MLGRHLKIYKSEYERAHEQFIVASIQKHSVVIVEGVVISYPFQKYNKPTGVFCVYEQLWNQVMGSVLKICYWR